MAEEGKTGLTWEHRLGLWLPRPLLLGAFLAATCISATYLSFQWLLDLRVHPSAFGIVWFIALSLTGTRYFLAPSASFAAVPPSESHETEVQALHVSIAKIRHSRFAGAAGVLMFAGFWELTLVVAGSDRVGSWYRLHDNSASLVLYLWLGWIAGRFAYFMFAGFYAPAGPKKCDGDLLNLENVYAFGRSGLRGSLPWFIALGIGYFLILPGLGTGVWVILSLSAINLAWALLFLLAPGREVRSLIRNVKREELVRLEPLLREARDDALTGDVSMQGRLTDLLAYKIQVESTPAWPPVNSFTLLRFGFFLLVPFASMVAGALVDRVVALVLD